MKPATPELLPATCSEQSLAVAPAQSQAITIEAAFNAAASKALDKDSLDVMKQLLAMSAEKEFNRAFTKLQSELPVIVASSVIPNRGKYERYEDIMHKHGVWKLLSKHGFSVSYDQETGDGKITVTCWLCHEGGHKRPTRFTARSGGRADSDLQSDCKTSTTVKRNAFILAVGLTIRQDALTEEHDAALEGNPDDVITPEQAEELDERVALTNSDKAAFLRFAGAKSFKEIRASKYDELDKLLRRKEQEGK